MTTAADFDALRSHAVRLQDTRLPRVIADDPMRATDFSLREGPLYANFARQCYDHEALQALFALGERAGLEPALRALFDGTKVNATESRPALHTALRSDLSRADVARQAHAAARAMRGQMTAMIAGIEGSGATDVVSIGIGGSDLGPRLLVDALRTPGEERLRVHFLSNVDGAAAQRVLAGLDPSRTVVVLVSKSFTTQETLLNGVIVRDWLGDDSRLYAVSANVERAAQFGIAAERILPMWDWVGGRYSLWSAVGLPIALALGMQRFEALLDGAAQLDAHVLEAPLRTNMAVWHALTAIWNRNALDAATQAVLAYDERLKLLPAYLQQLVMESLGKRVAVDGANTPVQTVPVWWGGAGTDSQHSFMQALHQGTQVVPVDFIGVVRGDDPYPGNHAALLAHLLAQAEALANGQSAEDTHRAYPGNRPSTLLLLDALTPQSLGMLLALYEHSVYLQSVLWGINAFDQFGVELGKQVAGKLLPALHGESDAKDAVTRAILAQIKPRSNL